ncbi:MAG: hypothetical protein ACMXX7_01560 [Candidatus Woesearchaeota archaeon]
MKDFKISKEDLKRIEEYTNMLKNTSFNRGIEELERLEKEKKSE